MAELDVRNVYKIFGDKPDEAIALLRQGTSKEEVLEKTGQVVGVQDVSFHLESGNLFCIMGLSGSGKSTLLRCINRLVEPTSGEIYLESNGNRIDVTRLTKKELRVVREKQMAMIFQHFALFPYRTVLSNVAFGLEVQGIPKKDREGKAQEILELVGLGEWGKAYPPQLSGGMQQRVGLARALASEGDLLLMDEPFSALDPLIKVNMQDELINLQNQVKRTILFVTHDLDEALKLGDKIAIMEQGRIVQMGTPEQIIVNPKTEYVTRFVENADATGVITLGTIARRLPLNRDGGIPVDASVLGKEPSLFAKYRDVVYCLDENSRPLGCIRRGRTFPLRHAHAHMPSKDARRVFLMADDQMLLKDLMYIRLETSVNPVVVVSDIGVFQGVITEKEVLQGILEKGRSNGNATQEAGKGELR
ncbi:MAG: glycine betaine/L-proline ABC transporter ATP-binding protein [Deltaproteobacteria bacterium]|nr:glycine betaine/L-proline ABC transporter ATP-binding protein [Deltaproteobacteria bacterium]